MKDLKIGIWDRPKKNPNNLSISVTSASLFECVLSSSTQSGEVNGNLSRDCATCLSFAPALSDRHNYVGCLNARVYTEPKQHQQQQQQRDGRPAL